MTFRRAETGKWFETEDLLGDIGARSAKGGVITILAGTVGLVVTTCSAVLITRQLLADDFGLYGMAMILISFVLLFVNCGLSHAVIQKPVITREQVSTLFWVNLAVGILLCLITMVCAYALVYFFEEPRLLSITIVLSLICVIGPLGLQHQALLTRRFEHRKIAIITILATIASGVSGIALAYYSRSYWALVSMPIVNQLVNVIGFWACCSWIPSLPRLGVGVREMLAFGGSVTGFEMINYFIRNSDNTMLGYAWGATPLGLYTRAYSLMMLPAQKVNGPLTAVVVPMLSRLNHDEERFKRVYLLTLRLLTFTMTPAVVLFVLVSPELIELVLGEKWLDMIPIFLALSPACIMAVSNTSAGWLYRSIGHVHRQLRWALIQGAVIIPAMLIGLQFGAFGMAIAVSVVYFFIKPFVIGYAVKGTFMPCKPIITAIFIPVVMSVLLATVAWGSLSIFEVGSSVMSLILKTAIYVVLVLAALFSPKGRGVLQDIKTALNMIRKRKAV